MGWGWGTRTRSGPWWRGPGSSRARGKEIEQGPRREQVGPDPGGARDDFDDPRPPTPRRARDGYRPDPGRRPARGGHGGLGGAVPLGGPGAAALRQAPVHRPEPP